MNLNSGLDSGESVHCLVPSRNHPWLRLFAWLMVILVIVLAAAAIIGGAFWLKARHARIAAADRLDRFSSPGLTVRGHRPPR